MYRGLAQVLLFLQRFFSIFTTMEKPPDFVFSHDLNVLTTLTTYCLHMGHSFICFPQVVQVHMWPHSSITQSTGLSMQILHRSLSSRLSFSERAKKLRK